MNKTLVLPASLENLSLLMAHIKDAAEACGLSEKAVNQVELALEEILVNVISYAYPDGEGEIKVSCSWDNTAPLTIRVADRGTPFNPLERPDPDTALSLDERGIGGLGILLTKKMMNQVSYAFEDGQNVLTMVKEGEA